MFSGLVKRKWLQKIFRGKKKKKDSMFLIRPDKGKEKRRYLKRSV